MKRFKVRCKKSQPSVVPRCIGRPVAYGHGIKKKEAEVTTAVQKAKTFLQLRLFDMQSTHPIRVAPIVVTSEDRHVPRLRAHIYGIGSAYSTCDILGAVIGVVKEGHN